MESIRELIRRLRPDWHKRAVGGMWEKIGRLQYDFLLRNGLKRQHYLLDIGCGSLRGGIHFVRYLEKSHYFGIDINSNLLKAGRKELKKHNLIDKNPTLVRMGDFNFQRLNRKFDYALAQSVFTHLPLNSIIKCIMNVQYALTQDGKFFATFFESPKQFTLTPLEHRGLEDHTYFDKDPYHYSFETFKWICQNDELDVEYVGDWQHPRSQRMLLFSKKRV